MSRGRRRGMIERGHHRHSICRQCCLIGLSRSTWYHHPKGESATNLGLMKRIDEQFLETPFYGSRQMKKHLWHQGIKIGRDRVRRLMRKMGLVAIYQKPRTSVRHPEHKIYPYLLRGLRINRPNQVLCADITMCKEAGVRVSGGNYGLAHPFRACLASVENDGCRISRGSSGRGYKSLRGARDH